MKFKYKILLFLFTLFVTISAENDSIDCEKIIKTKVNYDCNEENITYDPESCNGEIKWTLTNSTLGFVEVEFQPCGNSNFLITLNVREPEENSCNFNGTWRQHSFYNHRRFRSNRDDLPKCSQVAKVQLKHIFSGCYQIEVEAINGSGYIPRNRSTKYLDTQYVKYIFRAEDITALHQQRFADNKTYLITKFKYPEYSQNVQLCFHLDNDAEDKRFIWNVTCPVKNIENICEITIYGENKNISCTSKIFDKTVLNINCNLCGLNPGIYYFDKYIVNEPIRCNVEENLVWGNKSCRWQHSMNLTEEKLVLSNKVPNNNSSIYLIGIPTLVLISFILILLYFLYQKIRKNNLLNNIPDVIYDPTDCDDFSDENSSETQGVLLLYARDCDIFMEILSSFRRMLEIAGNCEIFDIHDPDRNLDILSEGQTIWLLHKIMNDNIKIVLVLSECGDYLLKKQKSYKEPKCIDSLYNYGVRILLQNSYKLSRNKLFVTKFSFFDESMATSILSPDRRYNLDDFDHVKILVNDLFNATALEEKSMIFKKYVQFNEKCKKLITLIRFNPHYLLDILQNS